MQRRMLLFFLGPIVEPFAARQFNPIDIFDIRTFVDLGRLALVVVHDEKPKRSPLLNP